MITGTLRLGSGLLAVVLAGLAAVKLSDVDGYARALASFALVDNNRAWEAATLFAAVEACAAVLLLLVALGGRHAITAFQGGAALALSASLAYAILVVNAFYTGHQLPGTALYGTFFTQAPRSPFVVLEVLALLSWSAWLLTSAFLLPSEPPPRRPRRRRARRKPALTSAG